MPTLPHLMLPKTTVKICGYSGVQGIIFAFKDVDKIWHICKSRLAHYVRSLDFLLLGEGV
jgi:hypothetical protein